MVGSLCRRIEKRRETLLAHNGDGHERNCFLPQSHLDALHLSIYGDPESIMDQVPDPDPTIHHLVGSQMRSPSFLHFILFFASHHKASPGSRAGSLKSHPDFNYPAKTAVSSPFSLRQTTKKVQLLCWLLCTLCSPMCVKKQLLDQMAEILRTGGYYYTSYVTDGTT